MLGMKRSALRVRLAGPPRPNRNAAQLPRPEVRPERRGVSGPPFPADIASETLAHAAVRARVPLATSLPSVAGVRVRLVSRP
jgi:hypothetical protein